MLLLHLQVMCQSAAGTLTYEDVTNVGGSVGIVTIQSNYQDSIATTQKLLKEEV